MINAVSHSFWFKNHLDCFGGVSCGYKWRQQFYLYRFFFQQNTLKTTLAAKLWEKTKLRWKKNCVKSKILRINDLQNYERKKNSDKKKIIGEIEDLKHKIRLYFFLPHLVSKWIPGGQFIP